MSAKPSGQPRLKRRELLAAIGLSAIAGCESSRTIDPPTESRTDLNNVNSNQSDCIERSQYIKLRDRYDDLANDYEALREQYIDLREKASTAKFPPYIVSDRRYVSVTFETLSGEIEGWQWDSSTLSAQFASGFIIRELTYYQLERIGWDDFGFEGNSKYSQLGNYGLYYQLNPFFVPSNFTPLAEKFYRRQSSDFERIRAAWNFTNQLNDYVREINETPRFPLETLLMGGGDCEDSSILLGSLIYAMPADYNLTYWYIDSDNPTDPENINHVVLSVETGDGSLIIETTSDEMNPWGEINGFSVPVEPTQSLNP